MQALFCSGLLCLVQHLAQIHTCTRVCVEEDERGGQHIPINDTACVMSRAPGSHSGSEIVFLMTLVLSLIDQVLGVARFRLLVSEAC